MNNPLAKHVPVVNFKLKVGKPLAKHVPAVNIKIRMRWPLAKHVTVVDFKIKVGSPLAKHVPVVNFKIKMSSCLANHVQVVPTALLKPQVVRILQQHVHLEHMLRQQHLVKHARSVLTLVLELEHQIVRHLVRLVTM